MLALLAAATAVHAADRHAEDPRPIQPLAAWVSDGDYPADAIRRGASGAVAFTVEIDAHGRPTRCTVTASADPILDQRTCEIFMTRARFHPARDARGRAVPGSISSRMRWVLPEGSDGLPFVPLRFVTTISFTADAVRCGLTLEGQEVPGWGESTQCRAFADADQIAAMRAGGRPTDWTFVFDVEPAGTEPRPPAAGRGELMHESLARISVGTDGRILECRPTRQQAYGPMGAFRGLADPCNLPLILGQAFAAAPALAAPRFGGFSMRIYRRVANVPR